jgi:hypothetical protein
MGEVFGQYDNADWLMMLKLRKNLRWYQQNNLTEGYKKEKNIYLHIMKKVY